MRGTGSTQTERRRGVHGQKCCEFGAIDNKWAWLVTPPIIMVEVDDDAGYIVDITEAEGGRCQSTAVGSW